MYKCFLSCHNVILQLSLWKWYIRTSNSKAKICTYFISISIFYQISSANAWEIPKAQYIARQRKKTMLKIFYMAPSMNSNYTFIARKSLFLSLFNRWPTQNHHIIKYTHTQSNAMNLLTCNFRSSTTKKAFTFEWENE